MGLIFVGLILTDHFTNMKIFPSRALWSYDSNSQLFDLSIISRLNHTTFNVNGIPSSCKMSDWDDDEDSAPVSKLPPVMPKPPVVDDWSDNDDDNAGASKHASRRLERDEWNGGGRGRGVGATRGWSDLGGRGRGSFRGGFQQSSDRNGGRDWNDKGRSDFDRNRSSFSKNDFDGRDNERKSFRKDQVKQTLFHEDIRVLQS